MNVDRVMHTPGPWRKDAFGFLVGSSGERVLVADSGIGMASGARNPERYANARVIEAAPELLDALQVVRMSHGWKGMSEQLKELIKLAIAKATGETL